MQETKRAAIIDEFGELSDQLARIAPAIQRQQLLKAEIESWYRNEPGDQNYVIAGGRYEVQIGAREYRRKIVAGGMARLFTILGKVRFLASCTFPLGTLDQVTTIADQGRLLEKERTGPRTIKSVALVIEQPAKKNPQRETAASGRRKSPPAAPAATATLDVST